MRLFFVLFFCWGTSFLAAQNTERVETDTLRTDTLATQNEPPKKGLWKRITDKKYPNPTRAAFLSLALPGAGQYYNKKYWKMPIVYAGIGGLLWVAIDQQDKYKYYKTQHRYKVDGDTSTVVDARLERLDGDALRTIRNRFDKSRQRAFVGVGVLWILNAIDAFVDAHLQSFDVSEALTLHIQPQSQWDFQNNTPVMGLRFSLQPQSTKHAPLFIW